MRTTLETVERYTGVLPEGQGCCAPAPPAGLSEDATRAAVARCKALGDPTRLRMLAMLAKSDEPLCVCELNEAFDLEQPTVSHHLKVLRKAGLVSAERRGTWAYYGLRPDAASWVRLTLGALPG